MLYIKDSIRNCHYTLFVEIDEYDVLANNYAFARINTISKEKIRNIEGFFKQAFFVLLKQGYGGVDLADKIISKYILFGITLAFWARLSSLSDAFIISGFHDLNGICGFTEGDIKAIFQCYLNKGEEEAEGMIYSI